MISIVPGRSWLRRARGAVPLTFLASLTLACHDGTAPPSAAALSITTQPPGSAQVAMPLSQEPVVELRDQNGAPVAQAGVHITVAIEGGLGTLDGITTRATDAAGRASFPGLIINSTVGAHALQFSAPNLPAVSTSAIDLAAGPPAIVRAVSATTLQATVNSAAPTLPAVAVTDAGGNPIGGLTVTFTAGNGAGTLAGATQTTDDAGTVTLGGWTLPTVAGRYTITATAPDVPGAGVTFEMNAAADVPVTLQPTGGADQSALYGRSLGTPLAVRAVDQYGNPTPGITVAWEIVSGGGTFASSATTTDAAGTAQAVYQLGLVPGPNVARASIASPALTVEFNETALGFANAIAVGSNHSCAIDEAGTAYCWGANTAGQLGDGTTASRSAPRPVAGDLRFRTISSGFDVTCALTTDDVPYCWGANASGTLGDGTLTDRHEPTAVSGDHRFTAISPNLNASCGVTDTGVAYCWGDARGGLLGVGSATLETCATPSGGSFSCSRTPVAVAGGLSFTSVGVGTNHACGLTSAGALYCWGYGLYYGSTGADLEPVAVASTLAFTAITTGGTHTCGIVAPSSAYCWGSSSNGDIGNGTTDQLQPTPFKLDLGGAVPAQIRAGRVATCTVVADGHAFCWGENLYGAIGDNTSGNDRTTPTMVLGDVPFTAVVTSGQHSCGRAQNGQVYCWGFNAYGEVGTTGSYLTPALVRP